VASEGADFLKPEGKMANAGLFLDILPVFSLFLFMASLVMFGRHITQRRVEFLRARIVHQQKKA